MKTNLPEAITTVQEAVVFLRELHTNGESFHPEDDATDVVWNTPLYQHPGREECKQLNKLMDDIYNLPGNDGSHSDPLAFDPCGYLLDIEKYQTYCRDNGLADDSDVISYEDMHTFVMEHIEVDDEHIDNLIDENGCVEDEDDRVFTQEDMLFFACEMVRYFRYHPELGEIEMNAHILNETHYLEGDGSYKTYKLPARP